MPANPHLDWLPWRLGLRAVVIAAGLRRGTATIGRVSDTTSDPALRSILREVFGYDAFRGLQGEIVGHVAAGGDALVLMPTGGGKSLTYQIPAIARHRAGRGVTLVVSPLIALMHDQVGALEEAGVHAAFLNSTLDGDEARPSASSRRDSSRCSTPCTSVDCCR